MALRVILPISSAKDACLDINNADGGEERFTHPTVSLVRADSPRVRYGTARVGALRKTEAKPLELRVINQRLVWLQWFWQQSSPTTWSAVRRIDISVIHVNLDIFLSVCAPYRGPQSICVTIIVYLSLSFHLELRFSIHLVAVSFITLVNDVTMVEEGAPVGREYKGAVVEPIFRSFEEDMKFITRVTPWKYQVYLRHNLSVVRGSIWTDVRHGPSVRSSGVTLSRGSLTANQPTHPTNATASSILSHLLSIHNRHIW